MSLEKYRTLNSRVSGRLVLAVWLVLWGLFMQGLEAAELRRLEVDESKARSGAIVVAGGGTLVHIAQLMPLDAKGKLGDTNLQVEAVFDLLDKVLVEAETSREMVVKLNVYVARDEVTPLVRAEINRRFGKNLPAVAYVRGGFLQKGILFSMGAVAVSSKEADKVVSRQIAGIHPVPGGSHYTLLPEGRKAYVSGVTGDGTMAVATADALKQLWVMLDVLKATPAQIVQFKVFLNPLTEQQVVVDEIKKRFPQGELPVVSLVEWTTTAPIEIEMIVALPMESGLPVIDYLTPPELKPSPVYSRIARINGGQEVYFSGLFGEATVVGEKQVVAIFGELKHLAEAAGSDLRHLAKATYYVASDAANRRLTTIRTEQYDPARPPAASKVAVMGTGLTGRMVTLDMIAVTNE